jgi:cyclic lactone autoinducer peptide
VEGLFHKFMIKYGLKLSALAISIASVSTMCCRGIWYQPQEPDNLQQLFKK